MADANVHSGPEAVLSPRRLPLFGGPRGVLVVAVSAGKHHTLASTAAGELFSWGSNRDGRLGYTGADTQATPRRVQGALKGVAVVGRGLHSFPFQLNLSSSVHRMTQINS